MRFLMFTFFAATIVPVVAVCARLWPAVAARWKQAGFVPRAGLILVWLLASGMLILSPHENRFSGLDEMAYGNMARAFLGGRGFHDRDVVMEQVPADLRENFLFRRGSLGRPTRDRVFRLSDWQAVETQPFFIPVLPLAAAGPSPVLAPEQFVPLMGSLGLAILLMTGFCSGGGWGVMAIAALVLGTAWPAWFLRGFFPEAVAGVLVSIVVSAASVHMLRQRMLFVFGFILGLSVSYHPTLLVLAMPVALGLVWGRGNLKDALLMVAGSALGLMPFLAINLFICQPYGIILDWRQICRVVSASPEHRVLAWFLAVLLLLFLALFVAGSSGTLRKKLANMPAGVSSGFCFLLCAMPLFVILVPAVLRSSFGQNIQVGASSIWSGIRMPYGLLILLASMVILFAARPAQYRIWQAGLWWGALFFIFLQGHETPVGLWSQRRFLPVLLVGIACMASPLSSALSRIGHRRVLRAFAVLFFGFAGLSSLLRWPAAYAACNEEGSSAWVRDVSGRIGTNRWVVFDYYPHSIPYAGDLKMRVLGVGEPSRGNWPQVAEWLAPVAASSEVWVATSWNPCTLEEGGRLEEVLAVTGRFPIVKSKHFFPAVLAERVVENHFMRMVPLEPDSRPAQDKLMDESPIGLRGPWGRPKDSGSGRMARWTRQGSGIIGPVPGPGDHIRFEMECAFGASDPAWTSQTVCVSPPWGGDPAKVQVNADWQTIRIEFDPPPDGWSGPRTGVYSLSVEKPYDPRIHGLRGYPRDLGVQVRRVRIWIESPGISMPDYGNE